MAALCFKRLIERQGADKMAPSTLLKAVLAFHRTGDKVDKQAAWEMLATKVGGAVRLGERHGQGAAGLFEVC
jgi:hypothetical protein